MADFNPGPAPEHTGAPKCSAEYSPNSGGYGGEMFEGAGSPGEKEGMPSAGLGAASDDGAHDISGQASNAAAHGRPAVHAVPESVEGSIEAGNPTAAEGATGPIGY